MEPEKLFAKMKDTQSTSYKTKEAVYNALHVMLVFIVFPAVFCCFIAGGAFVFIDSVYENGGKLVFAPFEKSVSAQKTTVSPEGEAEEDIRDHNEELLSVLYDFDYSAVPEGKVGIVPVSLHREIKDDQMFFSHFENRGYADYKEYLDKSLAVKYEPDDSYQVLIIHTHGTEAYSDENALYTDPHSYPRSDKKEENVVCIGDIFERIFNESGLKTVHCEIPIDKESYSNAYSNAAGIIKDYLKRYPGIKYMFDIHRDSIELSDGSKARLVTAVNGQTAAQLMFVVGSDKLNAKNKNWRDNLSLAVKLQVALDEEYEGLMRPINIKQGSFNQFYTPLSLLIEVGSDGNDIEEAKRSAEILAKQMVKTLKEE